MDHAHIVFTQNVTAKKRREIRANRRHRKMDQILSFCYIEKKKKQFRQSLFIKDVQSGFGSRNCIENKNYEEKHETRTKNNAESMMKFSSVR